MVGFRTKTPFGLGSLRASFYTGTSVAQAEALVAYMGTFAAEWTARTAPTGPIATPAADAHHHSLKEAPLGTTAASRKGGRLKTNAPAATVSTPPVAPPSRPPFGLLPTTPRTGGLKIPVSVSLDSGLPALRAA